MAMVEEGALLSDIAERMQLKNYTPDIDLTQCRVRVPDINRPALQLNGFYDHFDKNRIQLIGMVEYTYLHSNKTQEERIEKIGRAHV